MRTDFQIISEAIKKQLDRGHRKFIIFPFGDMGCLTKRILNEQFGITDFVIIDNQICKYNPEVHPLKYLLEHEMNEYTILFVCSNMEIYEKLYGELAETVKIEIEAVFEKRYDEWIENSIKQEKEREKVRRIDWHSRLPQTICGKYSYGPLCDHMYVEKVGAFCSFAAGCEVVPNHSLNYISTHPIMYYDSKVWEGFREYDDQKGVPQYMPGINPKGECVRKRITIGNDVWLGRDVIITNYSNIGDGVIAGAGTIITKDVPDYAIVVGNPARIIRYRFSEKQIECLKMIRWWDWSDERIIKYYDDLLLDADSFIRKHIGEVQG